MNITILPGAALEDAKQIQQIVSEIDNNMKELNDTINRLIPDGIETTWSFNLKESWIKYYNNSIQGAMQAMLESATNLQIAVDEALNYNA